MEHWIPWRGEDYGKSRLLLLGESAYSWDDKKGGHVNPSPSHSRDIVEWALAGERPRFMNMLTRGLANCLAPTAEQMKEAWAKVAFTNYIPGTVGLGREARPTEEQWRRAHDAFPALLADLAPRTVIVLGKTMWNRMPETQFYVTEELQAYRLPDGSEAVCWAVRHPSRGLSWEKLAHVIAYAMRRELMAWEGTGAVKVSTSLPKDEPQTSRCVPAGSNLIT